MPKRMRLQSRTAVVTGAASGIGRAIAIALARRGCHLALADIDEQKLEETVGLLASTGLRVSRHRIDVADRDAVAKFPEAVVANHAGVDVLVNNAGVAIGGTFEEASEEDFEWLFSINFWGVVRMTRAFLPLLKKGDDARVVNISSVFGLVSPPRQTAYSASKFAVRGFSNALRHELAGSNVGVTIVHPGGVATSIADNARPPKGATAEQTAERRALFKKVARLPPEIAAESIVKGIERRASRVLVGRDASMMAIVERLAPVSYWKILGRILPA